jgi:hypothetical protein
MLHPHQNKNEKVVCTQRATLSLGLACISFAIGIWIALPQHISWSQLVISYLMSSTHNPYGHRYAASGLVLCTIFLVPVGGRLRCAFPRNWATHFATIFFVIGVATLAFLGSLSFVIDNLGTFHDDVTAISLLAIFLSMLLYLSQVFFIGRGTLRAIAVAMILCLLGIIVLLFYAGLKPDYLNTDTTIWRSLAAWEWSVIAYIAVYLFLLISFSRSYRE